MCLKAGSIKITPSLRQKPHWEELEHIQSATAKMIPLNGYRS